MQQLELNKQELLQVLPTKSNAEAMAMELVQDIENGWTDPFEALAKLEAVKSVCEQVRKNIEKTVRAELEKYGKEGHMVLEAKFDLAELGVKYDYSKDPVWAALKKQSDEISDKMKEQEKFLKVLSKPLNETNMDTGEVVERIPPTKTSTSGFKITLGK